MFLNGKSGIPGKDEEYMPPKPKFTKEEIVAAALELVSQRGMEALTARIEDYIREFEANGLENVTVDV